MATRNKDLGRYLYYKNLPRNKKKKESATYTLKELMNERKYIRALMAKKKKKKQPKNLMHVKIDPTLIAA